MFKYHVSWKGKIEAAEPAEQTINWSFQQV